MQSTATAQRLLAARPWSGALVDIAIAAVALAASLALLVHGGTGVSRGASELGLLSGTLAACATAPLVAWRRAPFGVFVVTAAASIISAGVGYSLDAPLGPTAALYLLAASRDEASPWTQRTTSVMAAFFVAYLAASAVGESAFPASALIHTGLAWAVAWFAGERTRLRREHIAELELRAVSAERETERERHLATAEERARIARDLHDSAGHAISVISLRAGTARLRHDENPDRSRTALEAIEQIARQTAADIDEIVGTLRDDAAAGAVVEVRPGLASMDTLVERHNSAGLDVTVTRTGAARSLGGPIDQATFRILQEALTNAARHGTGSARVELAYDDAGIELTVWNPVLAPNAPHANRGHGLIGMHERATLLGGSLRAERVNGAFELHAHLPLTVQRP